MSNFRICVKRAKDGAKDGFKSEKRVGMSVIRSDTQRLYKLSVSLPAGQRAIVPGRLLPEQVPTDPGGRYRASFEFMQPTDGIDLMAGPWRVREQSMARANGGSVKLRTYFTPELDPKPGLADAYVDDTRRHLERYSAQIGAYGKSARLDALAMSTGCCLKEGTRPLAPPLRGKILFQ